MNKRISNIFKGDKVIWMVFFFLCMISIVEVFSASSNLTYKSNNFIMPIIKHSGTIIFGVVVAIITLNIPCRYFKLLTPMALAISFITLLWVLVAGQNINGAQRVIEIPGFTFQPSEIAKGSLILAVAQILSAMQHEHGADRNAFKYIMFLTLPMAFLIMVENLSTALLLCSVIFLMMFIGRVPYRQLGWLMAIAGALVVLALSFIMLVGSNNADVTTKEATEQIAQKEETKKKEGAIESLFHRADTWKGRILKFSNKEEIAPEDYDLDKDAQVAHANIAIVSSNIIGKGPGNSVERDFLAQAFSDFIYAIVIEEMGILGAAFVVLLYVILMFRAARIASRCENNFPAFLIMGLALLFVVQASFNMMVAVGIVPVTGQPLPLISKGGTSTIINCAYIGAMLSVSRSAKLRMKNSDTTSDTSDIKESEI
ncbi:MAG: FtsW/RodA/SpoVE family cell cycle protein [Prevotella sp.]|nr:FtsW/RodA/SpoVE family cell cycle protein [Prevotella sp.]MCI5854666.1 FtsW/RodA/SpoVE family cell cycle protein [Prevotella sp.]MDY6091648.1 FtsW/RodA/SpoVE family cell cycle protein [Prevotella sp.]